MPTIYKGKFGGAWSVAANWTAGVPNLELNARVQGFSVSSWQQVVAHAPIEALNLVLRNARVELRNAGACQITDKLVGNGILAAYGTTDLTIGGFSNIVEIHGAARATFGGAVTMMTLYDGAHAVVEDGAGSVSMSGKSDVLTFQGPHAFGALPRGHVEIDGFAKSDQIVLSGYDAETHFAFKPFLHGSGCTLTLYDHGHAAENLEFGGSFTASSFHLHAGAGGMILTV